MIRMTNVLALAGVLAVSLTISVPDGMADEVRRIDPAGEKGLASPGDDNEVVLAIKNTRESAISIYWIDYDGDRVHYNDLEAGAEFEQITFGGHYWIVLDSDGKALGIYQTPGKDATITVTANDLPRIDPKLVKDNASPKKDGAKITLFIRNDTRDLVKLYWIDEKGDRIHYFDVRPGTVTRQGSWENNAWLVLDKDSRALGLYRCTAKNGTITVNADTLVAAKKDLVRIDPKKEKNLKSPPDEKEVVLAIRNTRETAITIYWIDYDGNRVHYYDLGAGTEFDQITFEGHYWVMVDSAGKALGIYVALDSDGNILVQ